jgi:hypothetical protein
MNNLDYNVYRCPDPLKVNTDEPWYRISNTCPCDPHNSNVTGRGFTPCPFGIQTNQQGLQMLSKQTLPPIQNLVGTMYNNNQYVPPQLEPRPLSRIGNQWRSGQ